MSRTFVHAPLWVLAQRDGSVSHDHIYGTCGIDKFNYLSSSGGRPTWTRHREKCQKYVFETFLCVHNKGAKKAHMTGWDGDNPNRVEYKTYYEVDDYREKCYFKDGAFHEVQRWVVDKTIPCSCDEWSWRFSNGKENRCSYDLPDYVSYVWGWKSKAENRKESFIRPNRHRVKNRMRNIRDNWNSNTFSDDDDMWDDDYNDFTTERLYDNYWWD